MTSRDSIHSPKDRGEQIRGSIRFVLDDDVYHDSFTDVPSRLNACAIKMFISGYTQGYHAEVIRYALCELKEAGMIRYEAEPYF